MAIARIPAMTQITKEFLSSSTWTCPSGVYSARFLVVGAGGAGGGVGASVNTRYACGGGGGGGGVKEIDLPTTPGSIYTITVGAKGTGVSASAGNNGGFSEIVLSGTTLVRALGGAGGAGVNTADTEVYPSANAHAGGGGRAQLTASGANNAAGGGGGAFASTNIQSTTASRHAVTNENTAGIEGGFGNSGINNNGSTYSLGSPGINGFGNAGNGGRTGNAGTYVGDFTNFGAGNGAFLTATGSTAGSNATYYGCGGGGASLHTSTTSRAGGDGFDGIVRITYFG